MNTTENLKSHVRFNNSQQPEHYFRRTGLNVNHVKFDLLKISELYDGVLTEQLGRLPLELYNQYLTDLVHSGCIYAYNIASPEHRVHDATGDQSFTYTFNIQNAPDRSFKTIKIHIGLYKSAWPFK